MKSEKVVSLSSSPEKVFAVPNVPALPGCLGDTKPRWRSAKPGTGGPGCETGWPALPGGEEEQRESRRKVKEGREKYRRRRKRVERLFLGKVGNNTWSILIVPIVLH